MAHANSLHEQYLGENTEQGIKHAATLLKRKGLLRALTKGPFYHNIKELLLQVTAAHLKVCWRLISGFDSIASLRQKDPHELLKLAEEVFKKYASSHTLSSIDEEKEGVQHDEVMYRATMMT